MELPKTEILAIPIASSVISTSATRSQYRPGPNSEWTRSGSGPDLRETIQAATADISQSAMSKLTKHCHLECKGCILPSVSSRHRHAIRTPAGLVPPESHVHTPRSAKILGLANFGSKHRLTKTTSNEPKGQLQPPSMTADRGRRGRICEKRSIATLFAKLQCRRKSLLN